MILTRLRPRPDGLSPLRGRPRPLHDEKVYPMIEALAMLLTLQLIGEVLVKLLDLPLPGPVLGMALLFAGLLLRGAAVPERLAGAARGLLDHLSLLFVPAGVGVIVHVGRIAEQWLPLSVALVVSTLLTIAVTGWLMQTLTRVWRRG